jgi:micrococcal nuclease
MKYVLKLAGILVSVCLCAGLAFMVGFALGGWSESRRSAERDEASPTPVVTAGLPAPSAEVGATQVASPSVPAETASGHATAVVTSVVDGDTIVLDDGETVRYIGIDAPESDECYGAEATEMNRRLVEGKTVVLLGDIEERGRYGRLLRYVIADGRFVNAELVRLGYARAESYGDNVMFQQVLTLFERYAIESGAGLWTACEQG